MQRIYVRLEDALKYGKGKMTEDALRESAVDPAEASRVIDAILRELGGKTTPALKLAGASPEEPSEKLLGPLGRLLRWWRTSWCKTGRYRYCVVRETRTHYLVVWQNEYADIVNDRTRWAADLFAERTAVSKRDIERGQRFWRATTLAWAA